MNMNIKNSFAVLGGLVLTALAQAAAPAEVTTTVTDLTDGFTAIKGLIITVVVFGLVIGYLKLLRRK